MHGDEIICHELVELATEYLEQALPPGDTDLIEEHLVMCAWCRDYMDQLEATAGAVAGAAAEEPPAETVRTLLAAFRTAEGG
jgi:predicted anti-sigma-YlaC factor YlaD